MNIPRSISQPRKTRSLLHQLKTRHNSYEYTNRTIGTNGDRSYHH